MLVVVKPSCAKCKQAHILWLNKQIEDKKLACRWFYTSGNYHEDLNKLHTLVATHHLLVVIGGDGTVNLAVNALIGSNCELAILPSGTGNDFARQFKRTTQQWRDSVFSPNKCLIDAGCVNQRYFINVMGLGYSAHVVQSVNRATKRHKLSYLWAALRALFSYPGIRLQATDSTIEQKVMMLLFANGPYFAAGIKCAPNADPTDGYLSCIKISPSSYGDRIKIFLAMLFAQHQKVAHVSVSCANTFEIATPHLDIEADGELVGQTPATISVSPKAIILKV
ncbi:diacylglycerol/lipid kinase family protein [Pseudoalteromonas sp. S16_S37]|uniref:diacylglycerol/lipid kinase family protein n=1 Tax=Pseudoalteromonas sp. S16_S37 TaxID=2720228 RepID=UPI001680EDBB|nr:YegS/Rv2252/BmrU family lipid kinase [Pseudoalteromonas sp. S16_S37]MBD1582727.1 YegS/Rv2252/BmrU family lipid kinase [Pseudoalteromonas sp. S16_S37]